MSESKNTIYKKNNRLIHNQAAIHRFPGEPPPFPRKLNNHLYLFLDHDDR